AGGGERALDRDAELLGWLVELDPVRRHLVLHFQGEIERRAVRLSLLADADHGDRLAVRTGFAAEAVRPSRQPFPAQPLVEEPAQRLAGDTLRDLLEIGDARPAPAVLVG